MSDPHSDERLWRNPIGSRGEEVGGLARALRKNAVGRPWNSTTSKAMTSTRSL